MRSSTRWTPTRWPRTTAGYSKPPAPSARTSTNWWVRRRPAWTGRSPKCSATRPHFRPPSHQLVQPRDVPGPAGQIGRIEAERYACPEGDYVWYRPDVGIQVPECPDHHLPLTRG